MDSGTLKIVKYTTNLGILAEILVANGYELKIEAEAFENEYTVHYIKKGEIDGRKKNVCKINCSK